MAESCTAASHVCVCPLHASWLTNCVFVSFNERNPVCPLSYHLITQLFSDVGSKGVILHQSCQAVRYAAGFQEQNAYLGSGELQALAGGGYEVSTSPDSQGTLAPCPCPCPCPRSLHDCLQVCFRLFRHDKHSVLMCLTRLLTTLAHLYNLVGWLKL